MTDLQQIAGANAFLAQLLARDWRIALCTGAWGDSARLKLSRAGLPSDLPLASCDDDTSREAILTRGIALAGGTTDDVVVSFDGMAAYTDDVRAAISSGLRTTFTYEIELRMLVPMFSLFTMTDHTVMAMNANR